MTDKFTMEDIEDMREFKDFLETYDQLMENIEKVSEECEYYYLKNLATELKEKNSLVIAILEHAIETEKVIKGEITEDEVERNIQKIAPFLRVIK